MAITISGNADMVKGLFSAYSTTNRNFTNSLFNTSDMLGINYSDYASIKSGSYHKLLSAYYSLDKIEENTDATDRTELLDKLKEQNSVSSSTNSNSNTNANTAVSGSTSTSTEATDAIATVASNAKKATETADTLLEQGSKSVFEKVTVKDKNGNTVTDEEGNAVTEYDTDKIYAAVKGFTDAYNSMMDSASKSGVSSVKSVASALTYQIKSYVDALSGVGITVNSDNSLKLDEKAFKAADVSKIKDLFNGTNTFAYKVKEQASTIEKYAEHEASKANTYTSTGSYSANNTMGEILDSSV